MAYADRVKDVVTTGGTGAIVLSGSPAATYRALAAVGGNGTTFDYVMTSATDYEIGVGTITSTNTFTRAVQVSSNGNAAVDFAAGAEFFLSPNAASLSAFLSASNTVTMSNKRLTARVSTVNAPGATPMSTISTNNFDRVTFTGLAVAITSMTPATSAPVAGDTLIVDLTDSGTARTISWGASYESSTIAPPNTTVAGQKLTVYFDWNPATSKWRCMGFA